MDWSSVISAVLAGGLAGQLTTLILGDRLTEKRDYDSWVRTERFKLFSELLALVSSTTERDYNQWPGDIRELSQKVYLLHPTGNPPKRLQKAMEKVFQHAWEKKQGTVENHAEWVECLRKDADVLRDELAKMLHSRISRHRFTSRFS